ncbi:MAG: hypothetical protein IKJ99_03725 [Oscillospiraceae bacterium]|nr:hypothetical protein [Oscillospiraceae bacterium]
MANKNDLILSLNEDTFSNLKKDFDSILNRTIGNMEMKGATDATITLKLTVSLDKRSMTVGDSIQEFNRPTFKHEVNSVMQIKDKATGQLGGEYAMVWDPDEERFVLRQFTGGQTSMFDDDYETVEEEPWGRFTDLPDDSRSLPAPTEEEEREKLDVSTPFGWLSQFIGEVMFVTEAMGNYTVRTKDNRVVLSSATSEENPFYCSAEKLASHVGHDVVCVGYGDDEIVSVSIECEDCNAILFEIDAPATDGEEPAEDTAQPDAEEVESEADILDYEDPEEE